MAELLTPALPDLQATADAPYDLGDEEATVWRSIVSAMPPNYFARSHYPMLAQLCRHVVASRRLDQMAANMLRKKNMKIADYDRLLKMQARESGWIMRLQRSMRLTHMSISVNAHKKLTPLAPKAQKAPWTDEETSDAAEAD